MTKYARQVLSKCPFEWMDVREAAARLPDPPDAAYQASDALKELEKSGAIEVRMTGSPPRVQIRVAVTEAATK